MMKEKGKLRIVQKNFTVALVTMVLVISAMLAGCGSSTATNTSETKQNVTDDAKETVQADVEETIQEEAKEEVVESTEEVETFQSAGEWAHSVDRAEPKMTIWNEITKEGIILENEQKYVLKEGDLLVICTKEEGSGLSIHSALAKSEYKVRSSSGYTQFIFNEAFIEETLFEIDITIAGVEYPFSVTFIPENATSTASDSETSQTTQTTELSGEAWVNTLEYDEPKLVVWNDETGTKEVIEQGGKYNMTQGDTLGIYCPEGYFLYNTFPVDCVSVTNIVARVGILEFNLTSESQNINLEAEILNPQNEFTIYDYVITTP